MPIGIGTPRRFTILGKDIQCLEQIARCYTAPPAVVEIGHLCTRIRRDSQSDIVRKPMACFVVSGERLCEQPLRGEGSRFALVVFVRPRIKHNAKGRREWLRMIER